MCLRIIFIIFIAFSPGKYLEAQDGLKTILQKEKIYFGFWGDKSVPLTLKIDSVDHNIASGQVISYSSRSMDESLSAFTIHFKSDTISKVSWPHSPTPWKTSVEIETIHSWHGPCILAHFNGMDENNTKYFGLWLDPNLSQNPLSQNIQNIYSKDFQHYDFQHWTAENGLASNSGRDGIQAEDGTIWIATIDGLSEFNGNSWKNHSLIGNPQFKGNNFSSLCKTSDGDLVIAVKHTGLFKRIGHNFVIQHGEELLLDKWIRKLSPSPNGSIVFNIDELEVGLLSKSGSISKWDIRKFTPFPMVANDYSINIYDQFITPNNQIALATNNGLKLLDPESEVISHSLCNVEVGGAFCWINENEYVATSGTTMLFFDAQNRLQKGFNLPNGNRPRKIIKSRNGGHWITSDKCVFLWRDNQLKDFPEVKNYIPHINTIFEDNESGLWIVGAQHGIGRLKLLDIQFHSVTLMDKIHQPQTIISEGDKFPTFSATESISISTSNSAPITPLIIDNRLNHESICRSLKDPDTIWVATSLLKHFRQNKDNPFDSSSPILVRVNKEEITSFGWDDMPFGLGNIHCVCDAGSMGIWLASDSGVIIFQNGEFRFWNSQESIRNEDIQCIYYDPKYETLWLGGYKTNLIKVQNNQTTIINSNTGSPDNISVYSIMTDREERMWISTSDGIAYLENNKVIPIAMSPRTSNRPIRALIEDDMGNIWFAMSNGIACLPFNSRIPDILNNEPEIYSFGRSDGLLNESIYPEYFPVACKSQNGTLYFCMEGGIVEFNPRSLLGSIKSQSIHIASISHSTDKSADLNRITIERDQTTIQLPPESSKLVRVEYTAISYSDPDSLSFYYRVKEQNTDWISMNNQRAVYLPNLDPGIYTFEVTSRNRNGVLSPYTAMIEFQVTPYFYQGAAFRCSIILAIMAVVYWAHRRSVSTQARIKDLELAIELDKERNRIARDMHDEIGGSLAQIRLLAERKQELSGGGSDEKQFYSRIAQAAETSSQTLREIIWSLNPRKSGYTDFCDYLSNLGSQIFMGSNIKFSFNNDEVPKNIQFSSMAKRQLTLTLKELMSNALKHSKADNFSLYLSCESDYFVISGADDGTGFDQTNIPIDSIGLDSIKQRITTMQGTISLISESYKGTSFLIKIPFVNSGIYIKTR